MSPDSDGRPKFVTVAEVAKWLRVSKMTVYRLVEEGTLPAIRVGRSFRIIESGVHDYINNQIEGNHHGERPTEA